MSITFSRFEEQPAAGMQPSNFTDADAFTSDDRTENNHFFFSSDDESVLAGVWECAPCREVIEAYPVNEMMTVLAGSVTVTDSNTGRAETFKKGDSFFIPKGTNCIWEITETLKKYYFIAS